MTLAAPIAVTILIVGLFDYFIPNRNISPKLTTQALDEIHGKHLDDVVSLLNIKNFAYQKSEVRRLRDVFSAYRAVIAVTLQDPNTQGSVYGQLFHYVRNEGPPSKSCSGVSAGGQIGLSRCTWSYSAFKNLDVLKYSQHFDQGDEVLTLTVEFDYDRVSEMVHTIVKGQSGS